MTPYQSWIAVLLYADGRIKVQPHAVGYALEVPGEDGSIRRFTDVDYVTIRIMREVGVVREAQSIGDETV